MAGRQARHLWRAVTAPFEFHRQGRSRRAVLALAISYGLILVALLVFDAAWWLMALLGLCTLPALWDVWRNPAAGLSLSSDALTWHSGRRRAEVPLSEIDHMRLDTRWDFSVRATAVLSNGKRLRLPYESLPPHRSLEAALQARGIRVERHHFNVF